MPRSSSRDIKSHAEKLLRDSRFNESCRVYQVLIDAGSRDPEVHLAYAGLCARLGNEDAAHRHLSEYYRDNPLGPLPDGVGADDARLLYVRGFDKTYPMIGLDREDRPIARLRGGHFTLQYLMRGDNTARQSLTLLPDSLIEASHLPPHALLLNTISDVDLEARSLESLDRFLRQNPDEYVINSPKVVLQTGRDQNHERLSGLAAVQFPRTVRVTLSNHSSNEIVQMAEKLSFSMPYIFRQAGTHTGRETLLVSTPETLQGWAPSPLTGDYYLIDYHPVLWRDEYYRKMRLFVIDGEPYPVVCHFDKVWIVHGANRGSNMSGNKELMGEELSFLSDWRSFVGSKAAQGIENVIRDTPLEFFGIDFNVADDGCALIYELNATMRHSFEHAELFPYKQPFDEAISQAFQDMVARHSRMAQG